MFLITLTLVWLSLLLSYFLYSTFKSTQKPNNRRKLEPPKEEKKKSKIKVNPMATQGNQETLMEKPFDPFYQPSLSIQPKINREKGKSHDVFNQPPPYEDFLRQKKLTDQSVQKKPKTVKNLVQYNHVLSYDQTTTTTTTKTTTTSYVDNSPIDSKLSSTKSKEQQLREICEKGEDLDSLKKLLEYPSLKVNEPDSIGRSPLWMACLLNNDQIVNILLNDSRVDVNQASLKGKTPLWITCSYAPQLDPSSSSPSQTQAHEIEKKNKMIISMLLKDSRVQVDKVDNQGRSPFYIACQNGNLFATQVLAQNHHVNVNIHSFSSISPLMIACQKQRIKVVQALLENKRVNVNLGDHEKRSPFLLLCALSSISDDLALEELITLFLKCDRVNLNMSDLKGTTPAHLLCCKYGKFLSRVIGDPRVDCSILDSSGRTPLFLALQSNDPRTVKELVHSGKKLRPKIRPKSHSYLRQLVKEGENSVPENESKNEKFLRNCVEGNLSSVQKAVLQSKKNKSSRYLSH